MRKRILSLFCVLALCLTMLPAQVLAVGDPASVSEIPYIDAAGLEQSCTSAEAVTDESSVWNSAESTWYVVNSNVTISDRITVTGNVHLILMDGGKGQVNIALQVLENLGLAIPVCGMVKDDNHRTRGLYYQNEELPIDRNSECFKLITRIQDEAHRFAITFHRKLRSQSQVHSILDDIPGVGPARRKDLMRHFENIEAIRNATVEELKELPSMNEKAAQDVYKFFH